MTRELTWDDLKPGCSVSTVGSISIKTNMNGAHIYMRTTRKPIFAGSCMDGKSVIPSNFTDICFKLPKEFIVNDQ